MRCLLTLLLGLAGLVAQAQFGVGVYHNFNAFRVSGLPDGAERADFSYNNMSEVAAYYWFRLPKQRIEFQPTVYYAYDFANDAFDANELGLQFKTNIYVFDLGTDCHCPTFGKQGPQLQKGLFVQLSPGVASGHFQGTDRKTVATIGAGLGLDIGISNLVTLTPLISYRYTLSSIGNQQSSDDGVAFPDADFRLRTLQLGLQATFRLDQRNY